MLWKRQFLLTGGPYTSPKFSFKFTIPLSIPLYDSKQSKEKTGLVLMGVSMGRWVFRYSLGEMGFHMLFES